MQHIYYAIRAITHPNPATTSKESAKQGISADMLSRLFYLESSLRGRQQMLKSSVLGVTPLEAMSYSTRAVRDVILSSIPLMLKELKAFPLFPGNASPQLNALLDTEDPTGILGEVCLREFESVLAYGKVLPVGVRVAGGHYETRESGLVFRSRFQFMRGRTVLYAVRELELGLPKPKTLRECAAFLSRAEGLQKKQLASMDLWPEFAPDKQEFAMTQVVRGQFSDALRGLTPEEQAYVLSNWEKFKPTLPTR